VAGYLFWRYGCRLVNHSHLNLAAKLIVEEKFVELSVFLRSHGLLQNIQIKWLGQLFEPRLRPMHAGSVERAHRGESLAKQLVLEGVHFVVLARLLFEA